MPRKGITPPPENHCVHAAPLRQLFLLAIGSASDKSDRHTVSPRRAGPTRSWKDTAATDSASPRKHGIHPRMRVHRAATESPGRSSSYKSLRLCEVQRTGVNWLQIGQGSGNRIRLNSCAPTEREPKNYHRSLSMKARGLGTLGGGMLACGCQALAKTQPLTSPHFQHSQPKARLNEPTNISPSIQICAGSTQPTGKHLQPQVQCHSPRENPASSRPWCTDRSADP